MEWPASKTWKCNLLSQVLSLAQWRAAPVTRSHVILPVFQLHLLFIPLRFLTMLRLEKRSDVKHGLGNVLTKAPWVLRVTQTDRDTATGHKVEDRFRYYKLGMSFLVVFFSWVIDLSYGAGTGVFAGDVECDEIFPNNDIRHTITIISHLGRIKESVRVTSNSANVLEKIGKIIQKDNFVFRDSYFLLCSQISWNVKMVRLTIWTVTFLMRSSSFKPTCLSEILTCLDCLNKRKWR